MKRIFKNIDLSMFNKEIYLIITTEADENKASRLANLLLREKLIPCVNFKKIESHFWWEGQINQSEEVQLIIKCKEENVSTVCNKISEWHSYDLPEIIYFRVSASKNYYQWVNSI